MSQCEIEGCETKAHGHGLCGKHYAEKARDGSLQVHVATRANHMSDRAVESIRRVAAELGVNPLDLHREVWRHRREPGDPGHTYISTHGGWKHFQSLAASPAGHPSPIPVTQKAPPPTAKQLVELANKERQVKALRHEVRSLTTHIQEMQARSEIIEAIEKGGGLLPPVVRPREKTSGLREATAVVLCSDWHVEESIRPEEVNGRNEYSPEVATARVRKLTQGILWSLEMYRAKFLIRDLVVWLGGDLITGYIHEEYKETNFFSPTEAVLFCQDLVATELLGVLLAESGVERLLVPCSYGNHGRTTAKPQVKNAAKNSYEWLMYQTLAQRFADDERVEFHIAEGRHQYMDIYDTKLRFLHGEDIRYHGGVGGLWIPLNKAIKEWNGFIRVDVTCMGHWHTYGSLPYVVTNGSLCGYSEFSLKIKAPYEPPQQALFLVDRERGKRQSTRIWVDSDESKER